MKRHLLMFEFALALLLCACAPAAMAATTCTPSGVASINVPGYDGSTAASSASSVTITCTTTATNRTGTVYVNMCLYIGYPDGVLAPRTLKNGSNKLNYNLFINGVPWQGTALPITPQQNITLTYAKASGSGATGSATFPITATIPAQTGLVNGTYTQAYSAGDTAFQYNVSEPTATGSSPPASCVGTPATQYFPFSVATTVAPNCRISVATDLDFGSIPGLMTGNTDQLSQISLICSSPTAWNIGLNNGANSSGSTRRMSDGAGNFVNYELYRDTARGQRWGTTINSDTFGGTGTGNAQTVPVYGRVPAQSAVPGNYSDVVTVTVTY